MTKLANGWLWNKNKNRLKAMDTCLEVTFDVIMKIGIFVPMNARKGVNELLKKV